MKGITSTLLAFILSLAIIAFATNAYSGAPETAQAPEAVKLSPAELPLEDIQRFTQAMNHIKSFYVEQVTDSKLFESAIRGMMEGLDPHSAFLDPSEFQDLQISTSGEFGGLGIEIGTENHFIKVVSPIDDTPAQKAGIKPGDLIIRINGDSVQGMTLKDAVTLMRGKPKTPVTLTIYRKGEKPFDLEIMREIIQVQSVKSRLLEEGYGYLRVSHFQQTSAEDVQNSVARLQKKSNLKGLVLDLRNNPGGLLESAIEISDAFLDSDTLKEDEMIVYTKGRLDNSEFEAKATPGDILAGAPIVVLINNGSASASEIVAGALQDHKRALIVGEKSFGKGSVQTVLPLDEKTGVKLTTALYYTPAGRSIQAKGISPDIIIHDLIIKTDDEEEDELSEFLSEANLVGHLKNGNHEKKATSDESETHASEIEKNGNKLVKKDFQLYEALNLLKGLSLSRS